MLTWRRLLEAIDGRGGAAMVTVAATRGSAPREAGARMIVNRDGTFSGTIGGGTLEWRAIALAQAALERGSPAERRRFALGPELGQCCGGQVDLVIEVFDQADRDVVAGFAGREARGPFAVTGRFVGRGSLERGLSDEPLEPGTAMLAGGALVEGFGDARRPLLLFGAGHVGKALVLALAPLPFAVSWFDPRPDAFPAYVPANVAPRTFGEPAGAFAGAIPGSFVLVMSHSHQLDLALVQAALSDGRFPYVGLIGSKSKRARFEKRLAAGDVPIERIRQLVCPIGIGDIRSKAPAVIAAATAAQLLERDEAMKAEAARDPGALRPPGRQVG
ncbi:MAG: xanthine dehydrogenase accessory protein XdhC [Bauldia sp.]|uniref:xanthine dehydrogenase accessory protein XdhC n=1 Tax=Bauldia sp. TaxID=2575872 RepID=UPI001D5CA6FE|nr:xanthine dehydrogenase accessory protein XdhC [Bauldia sp.]MCB1496796.1 xanthine dehydrogenase accessory protein XdhC [Bauldia sp.]